MAVLLKSRGQEAIEGLVVTVIDHDREAVFVNIVGQLKPEDIARLGERLNLAPLKQVGAAVQAPKATPTRKDEANPQPAKDAGQ